MQIFSSEQLFLSLVKAEVLDVFHYRMNGWTVIRIQSFVHHQYTFLHQKHKSVKILSGK